MFIEKTIIFLIATLLIISCDKNEKIKPFDPYKENSDAEEKFTEASLAQASQNRSFNLNLLKLILPKNTDKHINAHSYFMNMDFQILEPLSEELQNKALLDFTKDTNSKTYLKTPITKKTKITQDFLKDNFKKNEMRDFNVLSTAIEAINPGQKEKGTNISFYDVIKKDVTQNRSPFYIYLLQIRHNSLVDLVLFATGGLEYEKGETWVMDYFDKSVADINQLNNALANAIETQNFLSVLKIEPIKLQELYLRLKLMDAMVDPDDVDDLTAAQIAAIKRFEETSNLFK